MKCLHVRAGQPVTQMHCKNEYVISNQYNCDNRLQAILLIKFNKLERRNGDF